MTSQPDSRNHESSVSDIYAEGLRYFMGAGQLNNTLTRLLLISINTVLTTW